MLPYSSIWRYPSTTGAFSIRELPEYPARFELWLEDERLRVFSNTDAAVRAVFMGNTGFTQWDRRVAGEWKPSSLSQWTLESTTNKRVEEREDPEENQTG